MVGQGWVAYRLFTRIKHRSRLRLVVLPPPTPPSEKRTSYIHCLSYVRIVIIHYFFFVFLATTAIPPPGFLGLGLIFGRFGGPPPPITPPFGPAGPRLPFFPLAPGL